MTHWVIVKYNNNIYAGADRLASGPDYPSELSGTETMPKVHEMLHDMLKISEFESANKKALLCYAGKTFLIKKRDRELENTFFVLNRILKHLGQNINSNVWASANNLMLGVRCLLQHNYIIDNHDNSLIIGCGLKANNTSTIAYYNSIVDTVTSWNADTLNSELQQSPFSKQLLFGSGLLGNAADSLIKQEIDTKHRQSPTRVGREISLRNTM